MDACYLILINILLVISAMYLFKEIKNQNIISIKIYLLLSLIAIIAYLLQLFIGDNLLIKAVSVFAAVIQCYGFIVSFSLYYNFKGEINVEEK